MSTSKRGEDGNQMADELKSKPSPAWGHTAGLIQIQADPQPADRGSLAERVLIAERMYRYGWAFDERQALALADCFTEDATWEANIMGTTTVGPHVGRAAIVDFMTGFWPDQHDQRRHMITNVIIESQDESAATALSYHLLMSASNGELTPVTTGFYRVEMRKLGTAWKICRLLAGYDIPF